MTTQARTVGQDMARSTIGVAWLLIFAVAAFDAWFAIRHRSSLADWEMNPFARVGVAAFGLGAVVIYKFGALIFAAGIAWYCRRRRPLLTRATTLILVAAHGMLVFTYVGGYAFADTRTNDEIDYFAKVPPLEWENDEEVATSTTSPHQWRRYRHHELLRNGQLSLDRAHVRRSEPTAVDAGRGIEVCSEEARVISH